MHQISNARTAPSSTPAPPTSTSSRWPTITPTTSPTSIPTVSAVTSRPRAPVGREISVASGPRQVCFQRNFGYHLIQTYLPTVLIVTISWVSFFLEAGAVPVRVSLGITTFLTMITRNSGAKVGLQPGSYVKVAFCTGSIEV
ncbi:gamma-aminobutyric acid receptor subunit beta-like [Paramacrobiotus metropolitanus]|uniref:gamma-aminobutyric acid receptor subunit beta-like n=1 Tax=Paramacrobiotus metropolitanus TaxID=2943436 RepID=UPI002445BFCF|nr:gamma-aminobutyric acid receptor subunit beta-like [Paramacrobiotus metropolitanus]